MLHHFPASPFPSPCPAKVWQQQPSKRVWNDISSPLFSSFQSHHLVPQRPTLSIRARESDAFTVQPIHLHVPRVKTEATLNLMRLHKCLNFSTHLLSLRPAMLSLQETQGMKSPHGHSPCPQLGTEGRCASVFWNKCVLRTILSVKEILNLSCFFPPQ